MQQITPKLSSSEQTNYFFTVPVGQESGTCWWFWLSVHMSTKTAKSWDSTGAGGSTSKLTVGWRPQLLTTWTSSWAAYNMADGFPQRKRKGGRKLLRQKFQSFITLSWKWHVIFYVCCTRSVWERSTEKYEHQEAGTLSFKYSLKQCKHMKVSNMGGVGGERNFG